MYAVRQILIAVLIVALLVLAGLIWTDTTEFQMQRVIGSFDHPALMG